MIINKEDHVVDRITVDLAGPEGNAFSLIGLAKSFCKVNGFDKDVTNDIIKQMKSSDYDNLVRVLDIYFGSRILFLK